VAGIAEMSAMYGARQAQATMAAAKNGLASLGVSGWRASGSLKQAA